MATHIGNNGVVKVGANVVAEVVGFSITEGSAVADDTVLGDTYASHIAGIKNWSGSISCFLDETDTLGQGALTAGASVSLSLQSEGDTLGDLKLSGTATITSIERSVGKDAIVTANFSFTGNGALTIGTVA